MKKKSTKRRPKAKLKKYSNGGAFATGLKDTGLFLADTLLAEWAPNVVNQGMYSDSDYGETLSNTASVHEAFDSQSPISKNVSSKYSGTDDTMSEKNKEYYNQAIPYAQAGSSIGEMYASQGMSGMGTTGQVASKAMSTQYDPTIKDKPVTDGQSNNSNQKKEMTEQEKLQSHYAFAMGGTLGIPNAELEGQEVMRMPDGSTGQVNGPSHEQGGVPLSLPPGTQVFSDRLKMPGTKNTFAKEAEQYKADKEDKIIGSNKSTNMAKATAKLIANTKQRKLTELFNAQEQLKQSKVAKYAEKMGVSLPQSQPQMRMGGTLPSYAKYPDGGRVKSYQDEVDEMDALYSNTVHDTRVSRDDARKNWYAQEGNYDPTTGESTRSADRRFNERYDRQDEVPSMDQENSDYSSGVPYRNIAENSASFVGQNAGNIWDLYKSGFGKKYDKQELYQYNPAYLSDKEALRDADIQGRVTRDRLKDMTNGNVGAYLSNLGSAQTANTLNKARIREQFQNINTGISNQAQQANIAGRYAVDDINARNKARSEDMASHAIRDIGAKSGASYRDYKEGEMDVKKMSLINQYFPNYKFDPNTYEMYYKAANSQSTKTKSKPKSKTKSGVGYTAE